VAAPKPHVVSLGKWLPAKLFIGPNEDKTLDIKVRPLLVDGRIREFTTGEPHDVTERLFVVRRAFRVNDWLPEDQKVPRWRWQRGAWLLVDRQTGRISSVNLPEFDPFYSQAAWYRDYAAYCGVSDNAEKLYAVVAQLGHKKPVLKKELGAASNGDVPDSDCDSPIWQRQPMRVSFQPKTDQNKTGQKLTFTVRGHSADLADDSPDDSPVQPKE
jgi:hypothetical protein